MTILSLVWLAPPTATFSNTHNVRGVVQSGCKNASPSTRVMDCGSHERDQRDQLGRPVLLVHKSSAEVTSNCWQTRQRSGGCDSNLAELQRFNLKVLSLKPRRIVHCSSQYDCLRHVLIPSHRGIFHEKTAHQVVVRVLSLLIFSVFITRSI